LVGERAELAFVGDAAFDAFGDGLPALRVRRLARGVTVGAGASRAAMSMRGKTEGAALVENCFAGRFFGAGEELPIITHDAPAARAFVTSPENLIPPSAMMGRRCPSAAREASMTAVSCGLRRR